MNEMEGDLLKLTRSTVISIGDAKYLYVPYELLDIARTYVESGKDVFAGMQDFSFKLCLNIQRVIILTLLQVGVYDQSPFLSVKEGMLAELGCTE